MRSIALLRFSCGHEGENESTVSLLRSSRRFPNLGKRCVVLSESGPGSEAELEHQMR